MEDLQIIPFPIIYYIDDYRYAQILRISDYVKEDEDDGPRADDTLPTEQ